MWCKVREVRSEKERGDPSIYTFSRIPRPMQQCVLGALECQRGQRGCVVCDRPMQSRRVLHSCSFVDFAIDDFAVQASCTDHCEPCVLCTWLIQGRVLQSRHGSIPIQLFTSFVHAQMTLVPLGCFCFCNDVSRSVVAIMVLD